MAWIDFGICLLFGILGVHKFREKKIGMGVLYLLTGGLLGIGWIYDCVHLFAVAINSRENEMRYSGEKTVGMTQPKEKKKHRVLFWIATVVLGLIAVAYLPSVAGFLALIVVALIIPVEKWQQVIGKYLTENLKIIIATVLTILIFITAPTTQGAEEPVKVPNPTITTVATTGVEKEDSEGEETTAVVESTTPTESVAVTSEPVQETDGQTEPYESATLPVETTEPTVPGQDYVLNKSSKIFHSPWCSSVGDMKDKNRRDYHGTRDDVIEMGYKPCGRCHP